MPEVSPPRQGGFAADAEAWFHVGEVEPGIHLIAEPGHVFSWLIVGSEECVLLDTGLGIADVRVPVRAVIDAPPLVVNSHVHFDHVGGNHLFERTAMHSLGPQWVDAGCSRRLLEAYLEEAEALTSAWRRLLEADRPFFSMIGPDEEMRPWPADGIARTGWEVSPPPPTRLLADGDRIDLGSHELRVLHTPGHAPDHMCLLDERRGILWAQDQAYYGPQLICEPGSDLATFARSARRLADELGDSLRIVYTAHCLRPSVPPRFLSELADAAETVAAGEAELQTGPVVLGRPVKFADFGHFAIVLPANEG